MCRSLQPCSTPAAYRRHLRHDERPCNTCRAAHSSERRVQPSAKRDPRRMRVLAPEAVAPPASTADPIDVLASVRWNLGVLEASMSNATPREIAALAKQHVAVGTLLAKLEGNPGRSSTLAQLADARRGRLGRTTDGGIR